MGDTLLGAVILTVTTFLWGIITAGFCAHIYFAIHYEEWMLLIVGLVLAPLGVMIGLVRLLLVFLV
jgi:hypothetical protein